MNRINNFVGVKKVLLSIMLFIITIIGFSSSKCIAKTFQLDEDGFQYAIVQNVNDIDAKQHDSSVVYSDGTVRVFGSNYNYQLGDGTNVTRFSPIDITDNYSLNADEMITKLRMDIYYSLALSNEHHVFYKEAGPTTSVNDITASFGLAPGEYVKDIFVSTMCIYSAVLTNTGRVFTWGDNYKGMLGDGTNIDNPVPTDITDNFNLIPNEYIVSMAVGGYHSIALTNDNRVFTWGYDNYGQLGEGNTVDRNLPTDITDNFGLLSGDTIINVFADYYNTAAVSLNGNVYIWGNNNEGQIGDNSYLTATLPTNITENLTLYSTEKVTEVSLGFSHVIMLTDSNRVFAVGNNDFGQLGNASYQSQSLPVEITSNFNLDLGEYIQAISSGIEHNLAVTNDGKIFGWGHNLSGEVGSGTTRYYYNIPEIINRKIQIEEIPFDAFSSDMYVFYVDINPTIIYTNSNVNLSIYPGDNLSPYLKTITINGINYDNTHFTTNGGRIDVSIPNTNSLNDKTTYTVNSFTYYDDTVGNAFGENTCTTEFVDDETPPSFDDISDQTIEAETADIDWTTYITNALDNSDGALTSVEVSDNVDYNTPGTYSVTVKVSDPSGNETSQTFNVTVEDTTGPTFDTITNQTIEVGTTDIDWSTYITNKADNSDGTLTAFEVTDNVEYNSIGTYTVTVKVADNSGNETSQTFNVIVQDTTGPTFDTITNQTIEAGTDDIDWTTYITNTLDNSDGALTYTEVNDNVDYNTPGTYTVTVKVADNSGNETSQTFNVIVEDTTAPTFETITNQTIEAGTADIDWTTYITNALDNSDGALTSVEVSDNVDYNTPGTYTVTVKVSDPSGNETSQTFNVTVEDTTAPTFDTITNQTVQAGSADIDWTTYIKYALDNSDGVLTYTEVNDKVDYNTPGTYSVTVKVSDSSGNETSQTFNVTVNDETPPTFDDILDQTIEAGTADIDWTTYITNALDNSDGTLTYTEVNDNIDYNTLGTYSVTVKVSDPSGNETTQTFNVTVEDTIAPLTTLNPSLDSIAVGNDYTEYGVTVEDVTDITVSTSGTVDTSMPDTYIITYKVTDTSGNETVKHRYVTVYDPNPNVIFSLGNAVTTIQKGNTYTDGICLVSINGEAYDCNVKENTVDSGVAGIYTVTYSYTYDDVEYTYKRYVFVVDGTNELKLYIPAKKEEGINL